MILILSQTQKKIKLKCFFNFIKKASSLIPYDIVRYSLEMRRVWDKEPILNGPFLLIEGKFISIGKANTYKWTFFY